MIAVLLLITILLLVRNYLSHKKKADNTLLQDGLKKTESKTVQGIIQESADQFRMLSPEPIKYIRIC